MRGLLKYFYVVGLVIILAGCKGKVESVKDSYWSVDKSIPIGKALDGYKYFESKKWETVKTENGREFVDFTGVVSTAETSKNIDGPINNARSKDPSVDTALASDAAANALYQGFGIGGSFFAAQNMHKVEYLVGSNVKKYISNNGRYALKIRFKYDKDNKEKERSINVDQFALVEVPSGTILKDGMNQNEVLSNVYEEKQLFGKEGLDGDPYWIIGLDKFKGNVERALQNAAADAQKNLFGR
ncbi:hypothetical protein KP001_11990 [Geomonas subterranea]|uniref:Lipoprotein n=1 Tax=Geomonas subterranea TaxID=2847989 RepID=A0ABX8LBY6_9BACT|nr:hypothetical protein [Geomonas subterranea]QXE89188.1 hypothetical protein KP001_11990 [Geomonas subterranea]QXM08697.1 hypothetical protein KP002_17285 [Geomonas subterranea]